MQEKSLVPQVPHENDRGNHPGFPYSARDIYRELEVKKDFNPWWKQQVESFDLQEDIDYVPWQGKKYGTRGRAGRQYNLTEKARELICMKNKKKGRGAQLYVASKKEAYQIALINNQTTLIQNQTVMMQNMQSTLMMMNQNMGALTLAIQSLSGTINVLIERTVSLETKIEQKQLENTKLKEITVRKQCWNHIQRYSRKKYGPGVKGEAIQQVYGEAYFEFGLEVGIRYPSEIDKIDYIQKKGLMQEFYDFLLGYFPLEDDNPKLL